MNGIRETSLPAPSLWRQVVTITGCAALLLSSAPAPLMAQPAPPPPGAQGQPPQDQSSQGYAPEQLDAILAPIALYPDQLLTQILMASAYPDELHQAAAWAADPAHAGIRGDALTAALVPLPWEPSVKSLVPFPQVLQMMTSQPEWLAQLGYAVGAQQPAVMDSVQRLRKQAEIAGQLHSTPQQIVRTDASAIVIEPAVPDTVYVPVYNPLVVYGGWRYPAYQPFYFAPSPLYYPGGLVVGGLAFGIGVGIVGGLWGFARPNWGGRGLFIDVNRYNYISVNRPWVGGAYWHPVGGGLPRPGWGFHAGGGFHAGFAVGGGVGFGARGGFAPGVRPPFHPPVGSGFHGAAGGYHPAAAGFHGAAVGEHHAVGGGYHAAGAGEHHAAAGGYHPSATGGYHPSATAEHHAAAGGFHPAGGAPAHAAAPRPAFANHAAAPRPAPEHHGGGGGGGKHH
jgi:hypothetical protein